MSSAKLNRLARIRGDKGSWTSYGNIGYIEAARMHAERCWEGKSLFSSLMGVDAELSIEVRCSTDDANATPHCFKMKRRVDWDCLNPRQGADDPKPANSEMKLKKIEGEPVIFTTIIPESQCFEIEQYIKSLNDPAMAKVTLKVPESAYESVRAVIDGKQKASIQIQQQVSQADLAVKHFEPKRNPSNPQGFTRTIHSTDCWGRPVADEKRRLVPVASYAEWPLGWRNELEYQNPISGGYPKTVDLRVRNDYEWAANTLMNGLRDLIYFWHEGGPVESWERDEIGQHYYALVRNLKRVHEKMNWDSAVRVIADLAVTGRKETTGALSLWLFWQSGPYKQKESGVSIASAVASAKLQETNNRLDELKSRFQQLTNPNGPGVAKVQVQLPPKVPLRFKSDYVNIKYSTGPICGKTTVPRTKFNESRFVVIDKERNRIAVVTGDSDGNVVCTFPASVEDIEIRVGK